MLPASALSIRAAVEATLEGRDKRLVDRCDVDGIVTAIELYGCYDCDELFDALESSFGAVQTQLGNAAPPAFLSLLKARLRANRSEDAPDGHWHLAHAPGSSFVWGVHSVKETKQNTEKQTKNKRKRKKTNEERKRKEKEKEKNNESEKNQVQSKQEHYVEIPAAGDQQAPRAAERVGTRF